MTVDRALSILRGNYNGYHTLAEVQDDFNEIADMIEEMRSSIYGLKELSFDVCKVCKHYAGGYVCAVYKQSGECFEWKGMYK